MKEFKGDEKQTEARQNYFNKIEQSKPVDEMVERQKILAESADELREVLNKFKIITSLSENNLEKDFGELLNQLIYTKVTENAFTKSKLRDYLESWFHTKISLKNFKKTYETANFMREIDFKNIKPYEEANLKFEPLKKLSSHERIKLKYHITNYFAAKMAGIQVDNLLAIDNLKRIFKIFRDKMLEKLVQNTEIEEAVKEMKSELKIKKEMLGRKRQHSP